MKTLQEAYDVLNQLSENDRAEFFKGKNAKLADKDKTINNLQKENAILKEKESLRSHQDLVSEIFNKVGNVKTNYRQSVLKLADVQVGDNAEQIISKVKTLKKTGLHDNMFVEKPTIANTIPTLSPSGINGDNNTNNNQGGIPSKPMLFG